MQLQLQVVRTAEGPRLAGAAPEDEQVVSGFLTHLAARAFSRPWSAPTRSTC